MTVSIPVSCIIPTHLRAEFLVEALASVGAQTCPPVEIIVVSDVDDARTAEVCAAFAAASTIPLVVEFATTAGGGASASRNRGAALARSEAIAFLDDDDTWEPEFLEKASAALESQDAGLVAAWITMFKGAKVKEGPAIPAGLAARDVVAINPGVTGSNMLMRRSAFESVNGFDAGLRMKNDTDFFFRYLAAGGRYAVVGERLVNQRKHDSGQLTGHSGARADHTEAYLLKHRHDLRRQDRKHMKFVIHRIRSHSASTPAKRLFHKLAAIANYTVKQFTHDRRNRLDREFFDVPSIETPADR